MAEDTDDPEYKVGYKKPPITTRFAPGQSGNPKGRPKKEAKTVETEEAMIERILEEKLTLANGKQISFHEALLRKALNKAAEKGNLKLLRDFMRISSSSEADTTDYRAEVRQKLADLSKKMRAARGEIADPEPEKDDEDKS